MSTKNKETAATAKASPATKTKANGKGKIKTPIKPVGKLRKGKTASDTASRPKGKAAASTKPATPAAEKTKPTAGQVGAKVKVNDKRRITIDLTQEMVDVVNAKYGNRAMSSIARKALTIYLTNEGAKLKTKF